MKKTCSDITIYDFIQGLFHDNYSCFDGGKEEFNDIVEEFSAISGSATYKNLLEVLNEIIRLNDIVIHSRAALVVLQFKYSQEQIDVLKKYGFNYKFDVSNMDEYVGNLESCAKKLKGIDVQLQLAVAEVKKIQDSQQKKQSEADFMNGVVMVSKFMGFRIPIKECTMSEYAGYINLNNKQNDGKGTD